MEFCSASVNHARRPTMRIEQIYTGCLAHGAYYIESNGEAVVIDPLREVQPYIDRATRDGAKIKYVLETHFHADFVSGHLDLAKKTGATIVYGPTAKPGFEAMVANDGQELNVGKARIWEWMFGTENKSINPSKPNIRAGIAEVWKGTAADLAVQATVLNHCKRGTSRIEALFAVGTGTAVAPASMGCEGLLPEMDISHSTAPE